MSQSQHWSASATVSDFVLRGAQRVYDTCSKLDGAHGMLISLPGPILVIRPDRREAIVVVLYDANIALWRESVAGSVVAAW